MTLHHFADPIGAVDKPIEGSLLAHVTCHFAPERMHYLSSVLREIGSYRFSKIVIVVDTNSDEGADRAQGLVVELGLSRNVEVRCDVHSDLEAPFILTWAHRAHVQDSLERFDYVMYLEDDILVPWRAIAAWHRDTSILYPRRLLRGFLRVEINAAGRLVSTDYTRAERHPVFLRVADRIFLIPRNPYHAFWIYGRSQMQEFVQSKSWSDPPCRMGTREKAACGMMFSNVPESLLIPRRRFQSRVLLPLDASLTIPEECFVYHLPANYSRFNAGARRGFGTVPVQNLLGSRVRRFLLRGRPGANQIDVAEAPP